MFKKIRRVKILTRAIICNTFGNSSRFEFQFGHPRYRDSPNNTDFGDFKSTLSNNNKMYFANQ